MHKLLWFLFGFFFTTMLVFGIIGFLFGVNILQNVFAQEIQLNYEKCDVKRIYDYMYVPFGITINHDPAISQRIIDTHPNNPVAQLSKIVPENPSNLPTQTTWITLSSNHTANWYIQVELEYEEEKQDRKVTIDYKSNTIPYASETFLHSGKYFCRIFEIQSRVAPHQFTEDEILKIAGQITQSQFLQVADEIGTYSKNTDNYQSAIGVMAVGVIVIGILTFFSNRQTKQEVRHEVDRYDKMIEKGNNMMAAIKVNKMHFDSEVTKTVGFFQKFRDDLRDDIGIMFQHKDTLEKLAQKDKPQEPQQKSEEKKGFMGLLGKKETDEKKLYDELVKKSTDDLFAEYQKIYKEYVENKDSNSPIVLKEATIRKILNERSSA